MPSTSERIEAASKRLASHSFAVDVLLTSLQKVQASPNTERYRKVNVAVLNKAIGQDRAPPTCCAQWATSTCTAT